MSKINTQKIKIRIRIFLNRLFIFSIFLGVVICLICFHEQPKKYVGVVVDVSSWSGDAKLKTKSSIGRDTIIDVHAQRNESFEVGQTITVWSGGELFTGVATTKPQN